MAKKRELNEARPQRLIYIGAGAALPGVPARDLSAQDLEVMTSEGIADLVQTGLYVAPSSEEETNGTRS